MSNPPNTLPEWASSPPAGAISIPPAAKRGLGWLFRESRPFGWINWYWNLVYDWITHLSEGVARYETLEDAVFGRKAGQTCIVDEHDMNDRPGSENSTISPGNDVVTVDCDGERIVVGGPVISVRAYDRDLGAAAQQYIQTAGGAVVRVVTDGTYVIAAYGTRVECWLRAGASQWVYNHTANVNDVATDGIRVYFAADDAGGVAGRALQIANGAVDWNYGHTGANLEAVACDGNRVFFGGAADGAGQHLVARLSPTGGPIWGQILGAPITTNGVLQSDHNYLYLAYAGTLQRRALYDGAAMDNEVFNQNINAIAVDQGYVYVAVTTGVGTDADQVHCLNKKNITERIWAFLKTVGGTDHTPLCVAADGTAIFSGQDDNASAGSRLSRLFRGNRARIWRRVNPQVDTYMPYRQLIIPEED